MRLSTKIYGEQNRGRDIVLIHGTGARGEMWRRQINPLLEAGFRCLVPDLRGHGESHEPGEHTDVESHLNDLIESLSEVDVQYPAVFAGHSLGSIISLELAERQPQLFKKILAAAMPGRVPALTKEAFRLFLASPYEKLQGTVLHKSLDWRTRELITTNKHALEQIMTNFAGLDYTENVPKVSCPVHFVVGRFDPVAPLVYVEKMHRALPSSTLHIIEWAGHNCMDSQPEAFNKWFFEKVMD